MATIRLDCVGARLSERNSGTNYYNPSAVSSEYPNTMDYMVLKFDGIPEQYLYRSQGNALLHVKGYGMTFPPNASQTNWAFEYGNVGAFDPMTVTYYNFGGYESFYWASGTYGANAWAAVESPSASFSTEPTYIGLRRDTLYGVNYIVLYGPGNNANKPYITIEISDADATTTPYAKTHKSGWIDRTIANMFTWGLSPSAWVPGEFSQASAVFRWRVAGTSTWNEIPVSGALEAVEVPAGTFPATSDIEWQVEATDNLGHVGTSETYAITTTDSQTTATPTYPISNAAVDETVAQTFRWTTSNPNGTQQTKAELAWTVVGSGTWSPWVTVDGNVKEYTYPANAFPAARIQWSVRAYNSDGEAGPWGRAFFSTIDTPAVATPIAPVGTAEDGNGPITFRWTESNDSGSTPTGADLQYSQDGSTWTDLAHIDGTGTEYTAAANTFPAGTVTWRVRAYNRNGIAGEWAEASFISVAAPLAPSVNVTPVPFAVINWQSDGQQAWRVTVDGTAVYGPYFGKQKSITLPDYLQDGNHTVQVEVQGRFGLWSQAGEATFSVLNVPGQPIQLSGVFYRDAQLRWTTASETEDFLVYRDGVRIAHTRGISFTDRTVLGGHSWQVINRLPGGYYTPSNVVQGALCTGELAIALLTGGEWLELTKSRNPTRQENYTLTQTISLRHFAGQEYPEAETSPYKTMQVSFDVSWRKDEEEQALLFESMIGKPIIYKAPSGEAMVGIMTAISKNGVSFIRAYTATVQRKNWRDFVDEDR